MKFIKNFTLYLLFLSFISISINFLKAQEPDAADSLYAQEPPAAGFEKYFKKRDNYDIWLGAGYSTGLDRSKKILGADQYLLTCGGFVDRTRWVQFNLSYLHTPIARTSDPEYGIDDGLSIVEIGIQLKFYSPYVYPFLGHYFSGGVGLALAGWNYSKDAGDDISGSNDHLWGLDIYAGTGFTIGQTGGIGANLEIDPGIILWVSDSNQGFSNSILPIYYYLKVRVSLDVFILNWR